MCEKVKKVGKESLSVMNILAMWLVGLYGSSANFTNASNAKIMEAFPNVSATSIRSGATMPALFNLIVMLICGAVVNKMIGKFKIKYRYVVLLGIACMAVGGLVPYFLNDWNQILIFRALIGCGMGLVNIKNGIIMLSVKDPQKQVAYIGYSTFLFNVMAAVASPIDGALSDAFGWRGSYLIYVGLILIFLIELIWFKEPAYADEAAAVQETNSDIVNKKDRFKVKPIVFVYVFLIAFFDAGVYPILSGFSSFMKANGYSSAATAGIIMMFFNIGGMVANFFLAQINKYMPYRTIIPFCFLITAGGYWLCLNYDTTILLCLGTLFIGIGFKLMLSMLIVWSGQESNAASKSFTTTLTYAGTQVGQYASAYYVLACAAIVRNPLGEISSVYYAEMFVCLALGVAFIFFDISPRRKKKAVQESQ